MQRHEISWRALCEAALRAALLSCAPAVIPLAAVAQDMPLLGEEDTGGLAEIRRYSVELIVFEYTAPATQDGEVFLPEEADTLSFEDLPTLDDAAIVRAYSDRGFADPAAPASVGSRSDSSIIEEDVVAVMPPELVTEEDRLEEIPIPRRKVKFYPFNPHEYTMNDIYDKLVQLDAYTPLLHTGWSQTTLEEVESPPIPLRAIGDPPLKLDGELTLYLGNYLHLVVDLSMEQASGSTPADEAEGVNRFGDAGLSDRHAASETPEEPLIRYRINEDRIVRNGELRYYDHPRFGVLARVFRVEDELEEIEINWDIRGLTGT